MRSPGEPGSCCRPAPGPLSFSAGKVLHGELSAVLSSGASSCALRPPPHRCLGRSRRADGHGREPGAGLSGAGSEERSAMTSREG